MERWVEVRDSETLDLLGWLPENTPPVKGEWCSFMPMSDHSMHSHADSAETQAVHMQVVPFGFGSRAWVALDGHGVCREDLRRIPGWTEPRASAREDRLVF